MKTSFQIAIAVTCLFLISTLAGAQGAQVGNIYVGTCDGSLQNTQMNETDVYTSDGLFVLAFHGPAQNACTTGMTSNVGGNLHVISAALGGSSSNVLEFDNDGNLLGDPGPFASPVSVTHDIQGNLYLGQGTILKIAPDGTTTTFNVAGGAQWVTFGTDQHTIFYSALNGDVKSYDVSNRTQGPDLVLHQLAKTVRALPDNSILVDSLGAIEHWIPKCVGCPYKMTNIYQVPANADSFALDPDGVSVWTINTYYDKAHQLGKADVYRTNIKTGAAMGNFSLQPLANGRFYSTTIGLDGDGSSSTAVVTPSLTYPARLVGTTSGGQQAHLTNTGVVPIAISKLTITGDFAIKKNGCAKGVNPGMICNVVVTFTPTQTGVRNGTLTIYDNALNSPQVVTLTGTGK
jgi:hypothetical protein